MSVFKEMRMAKSRVFVTTRLFPEAEEVLRQETEPIFWEGEPPRPSELKEMVRDVEGLLVMLNDRVDREVMAQAPHLKVIANMAAGLDNIDLEEATRRRIVVTHTPGILTEATADLGWALLMATARLIPQGHQFVKEGHFKGWRCHLLLGKDFVGKTLGIYGMGRIGTAMARRARGFGMEVIYHNRKPNPEAEKATGARYVSFEELLERSDFLVITAPLNPQTRGRFGLEEFRKMKRDAILINIGRGPIVKEGELVQALKEGLIWGAGLDVYEREPEVHEGLLGLDRVVLLPHIGSATWETRSRMALQAAQDLVRVLKGDKPTHSPNWDLIQSNQP